MFYQSTTILDLYWDAHDIAPVPLTSGKDFLQAFCGILRSRAFKWQRKTWCEIPQNMDITFTLRYDPLQAHFALTTHLFKTLFMPC